MRRISRGLARLGPLLAALVLTAAVPSPSPGPAPVPAAPVRTSIVFGTTFSQHVLGSKWRDALNAADGLGIRFLRIGAYWSDIQPNSEGSYNFTELDALLAEMHRKGYTALVTVGMKAPRWPEYYIPNWAFKDIPKSNFAKNAEVSKDPEFRRRTL